MVAGLFEKVEIVENRRVFLFAEGDGHGSEKHLSFDTVTVRFEFFKEHTLVCGMLVNYQELFALLDKYVGFERFADNPIRFNLGLNLFNNRLNRFRLE